MEIKGEIAPIALQLFPLLFEGYKNVSQFSFILVSPGMSYKIFL